MSYTVQFKGWFFYANEQDLEEALKIVDQELENPDNDSERSSFHRNDFEKKDTILSIDFDNFISASSWYGCIRVLYKISTKAIDGEIKCDYEGDPTEWVVAGRGYS